MSASRSAGRAVCLTYGVAMLPLTLALLVLLPVVFGVTRKLSRQRLDPWWPVIAWIGFVTSLPRLAQAWERRFGA